MENTVENTAPRTDSNSQGRVQCISVAKFESIAKPRRASIFQNFAALAAILDRHEARIHKRWLKKTTEQRRQILIAAWAAGEGDDHRETLSLSHRPDLAALYEESRATRTPRESNRYAYLLPHLNQEDLTSPRRLLQLLRTRARHAPSIFAAADARSMILGVMTGDLTLTTVDNHSLIFSGRNFPECPAEKYGELVHYSEHPQTAEWWDETETLSTPEASCGLLVLESQDRMLSFLIACARGILHEYSEEQLFTGPAEKRLSVDHQLNSPLHSIAEADVAPSWAALAAESPYVPPIGSHFSKVEALLAAKCDSIADHICALRDDPNYFSAELSAWMQHRPELLKDIRGAPWPWNSHLREASLWPSIISQAISKSYYGLECWSALHAQAIHLRTLQQTMPISSIEQELPEIYLDALVRFRTYLLMATRTPIAELQSSFLSSPPMRRICVRVKLKNSGCKALRRPGLQLSKIEERLLWVLSNLCSGAEDGDLEQEEMILFVDELQRILNVERSAKDLISDQIAETIDELVMLCQVMCQLDMYQPWAVQLQTAQSRKEAKIIVDYEISLRPWTNLSKQFENRDNQDILFKYGAPENDRFRYPIGKSHTRENVELLRKAETNLDLFWGRVDEFTLEVLDGTAVGRLLASPRKLQRTEPWQEPIRVSSKDSTPHRSVDENIPTKSFSQIHLDLQYRTESTLSREASYTTPATVKTKTRGAADPSIASVANIEDDTDDPLLSSPPPTIAVNARALKVFRTLFYTPSTNSTPGELAWKDLLHAFTTVGFSAQKLGGSVWQFSPVQAAEGIVKQSIHFHEPHPTGKMTYAVARRCGRRLTRHFGWSAETFVLAELKSDVSLKSLD